MDPFCLKDEQYPDDIIESCSSLEYADRLKFAYDNGLMPDRSKQFSDTFWEYQNFETVYHSIISLKHSYENAEDVYGEHGIEDIESVKDSLYMEMLSKFCKMAEDLGGLISSRDDDLFVHSQKFNKYSIKDVVRFYESVKNDDDDEQIRSIFNYPKSDIQETEAARDLIDFSILDTGAYLDIIKDRYLTYKEFYNSYKHGQRTRLVELLEDEEGHSDGTRKALMYYVAKDLRKEPHITSINRYDSFSDKDFEHFFELTHAATKLAKVYVHNLRNRMVPEENRRCVFFFHDDFSEFMGIDFDAVESIIIEPDHDSSHRGQ